MQGIAPTLIALRVVKETSKAETDLTTPLTHLTFKRTGLQSQTVGAPSQFSSIHPGANHLYATHSQSIAATERSSCAQVNKEERLHDNQRTDEDLINNFV